LSDKRQFETAATDRFVKRENKLANGISSSRFHITVSHLTNNTINGGLLAYEIEIVFGLLNSVILRFVNV